MIYWVPLALLATQPFYAFSHNKIPPGAGRDVCDLRLRRPELGSGAKAT